MPNTTDNMRDDPMIPAQASGHATGDEPREERESDIVDYEMSSEEEGTPATSPQFRKYLGHCDAPWCTITVINHRKCSTCDKFVHDMCDAGEVKFAEISNARGRSQSAMACSRECFVKEMGLPQSFLETTTKAAASSSTTPPQESSRKQVACVVPLVSDVVLSEEPAEAGTAMDVIHVVDSEDEDLYDPGERIPSAELVSDVLDAPKVNAAAYQQIQTRIDISLISDPPKTLRVIDPKHVNQLKNDFRRRGFLPVVGTISVALKQDLRRSAEEIKTLHQAIHQRGTITEEVWLVDGRNRHTALTQLGVEDELWAQTIKSLKVTLWTSPNSAQFVSPAEILGIGAVLNASNSNVKRMSFSDSVHGTVSSYNVTASRNLHMDMKAVPDRAIATALKKMNVLPNLSDRQILRYAMIGRNLAERTHCFKTFLEVSETCPQLGIEHMSSKVLFQNKESSFFDLALRSVAARINNRTTGTFKDIRDRFYTFVEVLHRHLQAVCNHKEISMEELFKTEFDLTLNKKMTIEKSIWNFLAGCTFSGLKDPEGKLRWTIGRIKNIDKWIIKALGPDILPAPTPTPTPSPDEYPTQTHDGAGPSHGAGPSAQAHPGPTSGTGSGNVPVGYGSDRSEDVVVRKSTRKRKIRVINQEDDGADASFVPSRRKATRKNRGRAVQPKKKRKVGHHGMNELKQKLRHLDETQIMALMYDLNAVVVFQSDKDDEDEETFETSTSGFNDSMPERLPIGFEDAVAYDGPSHPSWARLALRQPDRWPVANPVQHVSPYLQAVHLPDQHRGHIVIKDVEVLRENHHVVFWRAAHNYYLENPEEMEEVIGAKRCEEEQKMWYAAILNTEVALEYFGKRSQQLIESGYCILENFLEDHNIPPTIGPDQKRIHSVLDRSFYIRLHKETEGMFPGSEALKESGNRTDWTWIVNRGSEEDALNGEKGIARYTSTKHGIMNAVEQNSRKVWMCRNRALLDLRLGQCLALLKLGDNASGKGMEMYTPHTGGRWLVTSKECKRQQLHTDFQEMTRTETVSRTKLPGFFVLCTGETEAPLWVCPNSHMVVALTHEKALRSVSQGMVCSMVNIPPFSVFVGRGDMFHCGAAFDDYPGDSGQLRYHLYFIPKGVQLADSVHLNTNFRPRFRANVDDESDTEVGPSEPLGAALTAEVGRGEGVPLGDQEDVEMEEEEVDGDEVVADLLDVDSSSDDE